MEELSGKPGSPFGEAAGFWEPRRIWYGVLLVVVLLWLALTWPHFRPALTLEALGKMTVLALLANVCYCAAYVVEFFVRSLQSDGGRRRFRWVVWILGMLLALVVENYWIADEIYPDFNQKEGAVMLGAGEMFRGATGAASNMNFPAPLAVMGFLAASLGTFVAIAAVVIFWFARKPRLARVAGFAICGGNGCVSCTAARFFSGEPRTFARARAGKIFLRDRLSSGVCSARCKEPRARTGGRLHGYVAHPV